MSYCYLKIDYYDIAPI